MGKLLFWILTIAGLFPSLWLSVMNASIARAPAAREQESSPERGEDAQAGTRTVLARIAGFNIGIHPRGWASWLLGAGIVLVVIGAVLVLHVPAARRAGS